ncbi:MAG: ABC transporter ATP-binding protein [Proteobacteria bacterium]|nr:ABC transporter ATP-binding protein [Pseudomonadota bacterium]
MNKSTYSLNGMADLGAIGKKYALPLWKWYASGIAALIVTNIVMLEIPQLAKRVVNAISDRQPLDGFSGVTVSIIGLGTLLVVIRTMSRVFIFWPGRTLEASVKDDLFRHILRVPTQLIESYGLGDLTSRLSNDVTQLRVFFAFGALQVLNVIFMTIFTIAKMVSINPWLTIMTVIPLILMLFLTRFVMPLLYRATRDATEATGRLTNRVTEAFHHVATIQASTSTDAFVERSNVESRNIFAANMRTVKIRNLIFPLMSVMAGISEFAILSWGGSEVIAGKLSVGDLMAFNIYVGILTFPFTSIGLILAVYQRAKPAAERLGAIANLPGEAEEEEALRIDTALYRFEGKPRASTEAKGASTGDHTSNSEPILEIRDLTFAYKAETPILQHINAKILLGSRIGIYGRIGSGKTTLFNLMTRLYEPPSKSIFLGGIDIMSMTPGLIRRHISFAQQMPLLFSESIRDNLTLGFEPGSITDTQLQAAAASAQILSEIERFPQGWNTIVGESGVRLSGGQKQRLALARILLRQSKLLILDDVLSAVDHETERLLTQNLLSRNTTLIIASHRTSILEPCDEIWIMEHGSLIARGTYREVAKYIEQPTNNNVAADSRERSDGVPTQ